MRRSNLFFSTLSCVVLCLPGSGLAAPARPDPDFVRFWEQALVAGQALDPLAERNARGLVLTGPDAQRWFLAAACGQEPGQRPLLFLLDRPNGTEFIPPADRTCLTMDLRVSPLEDSAVLEPSQGPFCRSVQMGCRAVQALCGMAGSGPVGVVGEGRGAAVALAAAALLSTDVAFVCAYEPTLGPWQPLPQEAGQADLNAFARLLQCPALVAVGGGGTHATRQTVAALSQVLGDQADCLELPRRLVSPAQALREWDAVWQAWAAERGPQDR